MIYAGIGARGTPEEFKELIGMFAYYMATEGALLRSGAAKGADAFFEAGCDRGHGRKEIWLPELKFEKHPSTLLPTPEAFEMASRVVGHWKSCKDFARKAHARNCHQVLGADLKTPVNFIACWTFQGEMIGGTATALTIAERMGIPVLNFGKWESVDKVSFDEIDEFLSKL